jgi:NAD(P)-dependent dehydrogenase (short-subunit alcohol dehydrogenase family)
MPGRLEGKVALITGGGGGIGEATGRVFAREGATVVLVDRDGQAAETAAAHIAAATPGAATLAIGADLTQEATTLDAVGQTLDRYGALHVLVNSAGVRVYSPLADADSESWELILGVNLLATAYCCKAALPALRRAGGGSIVNLSSVFGVAARAGMGQYDVTKAGIISLTRTLAIEEAAHGIRVNAVCPGPTITPYHLKRAAARGVMEAELRATGANHTLFQRWAEPHEVAYPILFLACDESSYVTGTTLVVDGGAAIRH